MKNAVKKMRESILSLKNDGKLDSLEDDEILAVLQSILSSFDDGDFNELHRTVKPFQAHIDRIVNKNLDKKKEEYDLRLSEKDQAFQELKNSMPRPSDPSEIQKKIDLEADPTERRILQLEYNNAVLSQNMAKAEAEKQRITQENEHNARVTTLSALAQEKELPIHDPSVFAGLGERAEESMLTWGEKQKTFIEEQLSKIATQRYGGTTMNNGGDITPQQKTLEEISQIANQGDRLKAMEEAGY